MIQELFGTTIGQTFVPHVARNHWNSQHILGPHFGGACPHTALHRLPKVHRFAKIMTTTISIKHICNSSVAKFILHTLKSFNTREHHRT